MTPMIHPAPARIALQARDLEVRAGGTTLLHRMSLALHPGEVAALIGPSGAGKSTLLKALCGFRPASAGRVLANGEDLYGHLDRFRAAIGYVPQDDIIHLDLSVYKALRYSALLRLPAATPAAALERRVEEVIGQMGLADRKHLLVRRLSGGQRKRVSIGVELLAGPPLLFLDEPTSGLDPGLEEKMMLLLQRLAREGRTVAVTTHAMQSLELADYLAVIVRGHLAFFGPPAEALAYFKVDDVGDVFKRLDARSPTEWDGAFRQSPQFQEYVADRLVRGPSAQPAAAAPAPAAGSAEDELAELKRRLRGG